MSRLQHAILLVLVFGMLGLAALAVRSSQQTHDPSYGERTKEAEENEHTNQKRKSFLERTADDPTAAFTGALALLTAVLAAVSVIQVCFLVRADETARAAAIAATRSADALISLERPWMVAVADDISLSDGIANATDENPFEFQVPIKFINEGKTTAFIGIFRTRSVVSSYQNRPKPSDVEQAQGTSIKIDMEGLAVRPGNQETFTLGFGLVIGKETADAILDGEGVIWLFGYLEYSDFFSQDRRTVFYLNHNMGIGCVTPWGGRKENYMT